MYDVVTVLCLVAKAQFTAIDSQSDIASKRYKYVVIYPSNQSEATVEDCCTL